MEGWHAGRTPWWVLGGDIWTVPARVKPASRAAEAFVVFAPFSPLRQVQRNVTNLYKEPDHTSAVINRAILSYRSAVGHAHTIDAHSSACIIHENILHNFKKAILIYAYIS